MSNSKQLFLWKLIWSTALTNTNYIVYTTTNILKLRSDWLYGSWPTICRFAGCCLQICLVSYADHVGFVCRSAWCCQHIWLVLSADLHKCESGSPMFSSGPEPLGVKPCLVHTVHFDCSSVSLHIYCTFLSNQSLCLYVISFILLLHFKTIAFTACRIRCSV